MTELPEAPSLGVDARYRALVDVAGTLTSHRELDDVLLSLREHLEPLVNFTYMVVSLWDSGTDRLTLRFFEPLEHAGSGLVGHSYAAAGTYTGQVVHTRQPVYVTQVSPDGPYPSRVLAEYGVTTFCILPLMTAQGVLGALSFGAEQGHRYRPDDLEFMSRVATLVAVAVENATSRETVREQQRVLRAERDQLDLLLDVTNAVVTQLDTRALFLSMAPAVRRSFRADVASLSLFDPDAGVLRHHACDGPTLETEREPGSDWMTSPSGLVFRSEQPRIFDLDELRAGQQSRDLLALGVQTLCVLPLATATKTMGTLNLAAYDPHAFSPAQFDFMQRIAGQIAIAVSNARSYETIEALNAQLAREQLYLRDEIRTERLFDDIVGRSRVLRQLLSDVETVAPTDSTVLITGETGSGKELVARAIHQLSARRDAAFVKLNCAAIPTGLLESELFGHEKGAFTGAIAQRVGRFELAHRGSVFLDEIGEVALELQPKLLRVLQEREFERLGSARTLKTDARLIAATNRDLAAMVEEGAFRQDLFYRLNVFPMRVPPLRERRDDIPMLVRHFAQQFSRRMKKPIETIPVETMTSLTEYDWPGNIRELQNLVERAVILSKGPVLHVPLGGVPPRVQKELSPSTGIVASRRGGRRVSAPDRAGVPSETLEEADRRHILAALDRSNWIVSGANGAAARLGLKRSTLQFRMGRLGIARQSH